MRQWQKAHHNVVNRQFDILEIVHSSAVRDNVSVSEHNAFPEWKLFDKPQI
jgi:hypothetical protein